MMPIFDSLPLLQLSKFNNFIWLQLIVCQTAKNLSNFVFWKLHNRYFHNHQAVHHQAVHHQAVHHAEPVAQAYDPTEDVVDIAVGNKDFSTLVKIVSDLGLVETLKNAEAVTIFAPNDAAFAKLPAGTLESLTPEQVNSDTFYPIWVDIIKDS